VASSSSSRTASSWRSWVVAAGGEPLVHEPLDEPADRGQRHAEAGDELRHVELAGGGEEVDQLRLRHRDRDLEELGCVAVGEPVHEELVAVHHALDERVAMGGIGVGNRYGLV
jgi:hypothetical protein